MEFRIFTCIQEVEGMHFLSSENKCAERSADLCVVCFEYAKYEFSHRTAQIIIIRCRFLRQLDLYFVNHN